MLNPFPELLAYGFLLGPIPLRLVAGIFLITLAIQHFRLAGMVHAAGNRWHAGLLAVIELIAGALLFIGLLTQAASLVGLLLSLLLLRLVRTSPSMASHGKWAYVFLGTVSLTLLFLGAGGLGFDIPL